MCSLFHPWSFFRLTRQSASWATLSFGYLGFVQAIGFCNTAVVLQAMFSCSATMVLC